MSTVTFDKNSNARKLASEHLRDLLRREYRPEDRLPTLKQMAEKFKVGVPAVRHAVLRLEMQGYLKSKQGSGIYVTDLSKRLRVKRIGLFGRLKGHLWEEVARELVACIGTDPTMTMSLIPFNPEMPIEQEIEKLVNRIEMDELDVLLPVGMGMFLNKRDVFEPVNELVNTIYIYDRPTFKNKSKDGYVICDQLSGYADAVEHLKQIDCREILALTHDGVGDIEKHCRECAGKMRMHYLCDSPSIVGYPDRVCDYLKKNPSIDGVLGFGDWRVASILPVLRLSRKRIPHDLALIGFGDTPWGSIIDIPLSTVNTRPAELATVTCDMIRRGNYQEQHVIKPRLVVRASSSR